MKCRLDVDVEKNLVEKLLDYTSKRDFDSRDCNVLEIIRLIQEPVGNKVEDLCELQNLLMMIDVLQDTCSRNNLDFNKIIENEFTHITG